MAAQGAAGPLASVLLPSQITASLTDAQMLSSALGIAVEHQRKVGSLVDEALQTAGNCNEAGDDGEAQEQDVSRIPEEYRLDPDAPGMGGSHVVSTHLPSVAAPSAPRCPC